MKIKVKEDGRGCRYLVLEDDDEKIIVELTDKEMMVALAIDLTNTSEYLLDMAAEQTLH